MIVSTAIKNGMDFDSVRLMAHKFVYPMKRMWCIIIGAQKGKHNQADCPMGLASVYFDVLNHTAIDSSLYSCF